VEELHQENTEETIKKTKLQSTLSDPSSITSDKSVTSDVAISPELEKEDPGSVPDPSHNVVHRDAQGVVKSGTVKRQSRNFEEGRVNLPWEWEEALEVLEKSEQSRMSEELPDSPSSNLEEVRTTAKDEPPVGVVKMHAQKFQEKFDGEGKSIDSDQDIDTDQQAENEMLPKSSLDEAVLFPDVEDPNSHGDRIKEEIQRTRELFEKDIKKVNEDMLQEKSKRRLGSQRKSSEGVDSDEKIVPTAIEIQESEIVSKEDIADDGSQGEDPQPGIVKKHAQAIEDKYQQLLRSTSLESFEDVPSKRTEPEPESTTEEVLLIKVYRLQTSVEARNTEAEPSTSQAAETNENDLFDVDVL